MPEPPASATSDGGLPADGPLRLTPEGLYCVPAQAWIDPWRPVARALLTHAHADHARPGCGAYWASDPSEGVLRHRLGANLPLTTVPYGESLRLGDARISFHSAGHVLGSAQILIEAAGERWLISGDYKRDPDPSCAPFALIEADVLISEATFGLPVYQWAPAQEVGREIVDWWRQEPTRPSVLFCYAFGKAQRILAELHALGVGEEVLLHGAVEGLMETYRAAGIAMVPTRPLAALPKSESLAGRLVLAPPSAMGTAWMRRFPRPRTAFASGWMAVRGVRRRRGVGRGFVLSDHADWPSLLRTIRESGAQRIYLTHGHAEPLARYLREVEGTLAHVLNRGEREPGPESRAEADAEGEGEAEKRSSSATPAEIADG